MKTRLRRCQRIWCRHRLLSIVFLLAVVLTANFAWHTIDRAIYWADPDHHERSPESWMTPRYIARSWDLPQSQVEALLQLSGTTSPQRKQRLRDLARAEGIPVDELIARLQSGLARSAQDTRP
ncbi:hypothetical protein ABEB22_11620 [Thioclava sp. 'Guangxiensis']|uniref:hypothetical protein n=1 Tax=Thioclava sp. 'Guangxiensis' TaxID=3149044 RepID=UPI003877B504